MARVINFSAEVTDEEFANFLARTSGADGRKITPQTVATETDDETPNAAAPAVDKNNVAWHATYHSSSKALNADGTWRRRKGMSDAEKVAADAYDKAGNAPVATPNVPAEPVAQISSIPVVPSEPAPALFVAAPVALPVGMPGLPTAAPAPTPVSYEEVVALFGQAVAKDASVSANFNDLYAKAGITDPQVLTTDEGAAQRVALAGLLKSIIG